MSNSNAYLAIPATILDVYQHTEIEYTFRLSYHGEPVKPGQFFEVSIPKFGEAPISVSGIADGYIELTIRKVGRVTNEIFENYIGDTMYIRGPYGNGFDVNDYKGKEIVVVAGGTGAAPVHQLIEYFYHHPEERKGMTVITSFRYEKDVLFRTDYEKWKENMNVIVSLSREKQSDHYALGRGTRYVPDLALEDVNTAVGIAVGPPTQMEASAQALLARGFKEENIWISQERKMCCGIGKCGHCRIGKTYICLDGPVFNYSFGKTLLD